MRDSLSFMLSAVIKWWMCSVGIILLHLSEIPAIYMNRLCGRGFDSKLLKHKQVTKLINLELGTEIYLKKCINYDLFSGYISNAVGSPSFKVKQWN